MRSRQTGYKGDAYPLINMGYFSKPRQHYSTEILEIPVVQLKKKKNIRTDSIRKSNIRIMDIYQKKRG